MSTWFVLCLCVIKIVRSERNELFLLFSCYLIKPNLFLVPTQNHSPGTFCIIFTQVCHCHPVWAVCETLSLSFWVSLFVLKTYTVPLFSQNSPSVFFTCLSFIVLNGWKKSFLAAELFGRLKNFCYLLVLEWTKRSLTASGRWTILDSSWPVWPRMTCRYLTSLLAYSD